MLLVDSTDRYAKFDALKQLTELMPVGKYEYHKMVQTGALGLGDYGRGFLNFEVYITKSNDLWCVRVCIVSCDDGSVGGWTKPMPMAKAEELIESIASGIMKDLVVFPTLDELNNAMRRFGLYLNYE